MNFVQGISKSVCWNADHSWHDTTWILTLMGWFKKWGSLVHESKSSSSASVTANTNNYMYGHWPSAAFPLGLNDLPQGTPGIQEGHLVTSQAPSGYTCSFLFDTSKIKCSISSTNWSDYKNDEFLEAWISLLSTNCKNCENCWETR